MLALVDSETFAAGQQRAAARLLSAGTRSTDSLVKSSWFCRFCRCSPVGSFRQLSSTRSRPGRAAASESAAPGPAGGGSEAAAPQHPLSPPRAWDPWSCWPGADPWSCQVGRRTWAPGARRAQRVLGVDSSLSLSLSRLSHISLRRLWPQARGGVGSRFILESLQCMMAAGPLPERTDDSDRLPARAAGEPVRLGWQHHGAPGAATREPARQAPVPPGSPACAAHGPEAARPSSPPGRRRFRGPPRPGSPHSVKAPDSPPVRLTARKQSQRRAVRPSR